MSGDAKYCKEFSEAWNLPCQNRVFAGMVCRIFGNDVWRLPIRYAMFARQIRLSAPESMAFRVLFQAFLQEAESQVADYQARLFATRRCVDSTICCFARKYAIFSGCVSLKKVYKRHGVSTFFCRRFLPPMAVVIGSD